MVDCELAHGDVNQKEESFPKWLLCIRSDYVAMSYCAQWGVFHRNSRIKKIGNIDFALASVPVSF